MNNHLINFINNSSKVNKVNGHLINFPKINKGNNHSAIFNNNQWNTSCYYIVINNENNNSYTLQMKCDDMYKDGKSGIRYNWHGNYYLINGEKFFNDNKNITINMNCWTSQLIPKDFCNICYDSDEFMIFLYIPNTNKDKLFYINPRITNIFNNISNIKYTKSDGVIRIIFNIKDVELASDNIEKHYCSSIDIDFYINKSGELTIKGDDAAISTKFTLYKNGVYYKYDFTYNYIILYVGSQKNQFNINIKNDNHYSKVCQILEKLKI